MYDIITIGSATQDVFLTSKDYQLLPSKKFSTGVGECFAFGSKVEVKNIFLDTGGGATNTAVTFAHLGLKTACLTRVGHDAAAREIARILKNERVDTSLIIQGREHTAYSTILLTKTGERTVLVYRGASAHFQVKEIPWKKLKTRWFYVSSLGGNLSLLKKIFSFARENNISIAWNPGGSELAFGLKILAPFVRKTNVLIVNREEATQLFQNSIPLLPGVIAITDGPRGASVYDKHERYFAPSTGHKPVNTTGAGDAFGSAFVTGIIKGMNVTDALRLGILNSGLVVTKMGAKNGLLEKMPLRKTLAHLPVSKLSEVSKLSV